MMLTFSISENHAPAERSRHVPAHQIQIERSRGIFP
jgi:hypothetical protein